ncbi:MAG: NAD(P)/FAD-dependent oxidoreductase [Acidimicrobiia bacterium]
MRVVVVGAGIVGASTAFHLVEAGVETIVVDQRHPGAASMAGAGIVCPWPTSATDPDFVALYCAGAGATARLVDRLTELGETDTGYGRVGAIVLAQPGETADAELDATERLVRSRSTPDSDAGEITRLDGAECQERFPPLRDDHPGLFIGGAARLDGRRLTQALVRAARIEPRVGHIELDVADGRARGIVLEGERIGADAVVVAGGAWTADLLTAHHVTVDVEPQKGQLVHLRVTGPDGTPAATGGWPTILPPGPHYLVPFDDGRVVCGATRETGSGFDTEVTVGGQREVLAAAIRWAPGLADAAIVETRVGLRPLARSGRPTIGPAPGVDRLHVGTGMGAGGLTIGPHAGRLLADHVLA